MFESLPQDVQDGLAASGRQPQGQKSRLRVEGGGHSVVVLRLGKDGFFVNARDGARLRGHVDLYDGARHLGRCLIVAGAQNGDEMVFEFKRNTPATARAPRDFAPDGPVRLALPDPYI